MSTITITAIIITMLHKSLSISQTWRNKPLSWQMEAQRGMQKLTSRV